MAAQREWFDTDYYKALGVASGASAKDITKAYRKLAREHHPDANKGDPASEERFKEISSAYDVLGDETKRKEYDEVRAMGPIGGGFRPGPGGPGGTGFSAGDAGDLGDVLGGLFGRGRRGGGPSRGTGPQRGDDLEAELHLSFDDATRGVTTTVNLTSDAACSVCHGTGSQPGSTPIVCPTCNSRGVIDDNQGFFSFSKPCPQCSGRGMIVEDPCSTCGGNGVERRPRSVKVRIPGGVKQGQRIRLKGRGGPGRNGGPPGDLYVVADVGRHHLFGRKGARDLTLDVPITFAEAALGADIKVPTLDGEAVTIRIAPGTAGGRTFRVKNRGALTDNGAGDLLVTVAIAVPEDLSDTERSAVESLAEVSGESPRAHLGV
jgi:molecular chaperone DnaJ